MATSSECNIVKLPQLTDLSDITIYVGPNKHTAWKFRAHQLLLRASSPVFLAMLSGDYTESSREVFIQDIQPDIFNLLLSYIYKGEINTQSLSETFSVYVAADKYQMDHLKESCAKKLQEFPLNWDVFWDLLVDCFGNTYTHIAPSELKLNIVCYVDENANKILLSNKFLFLTRDLIKMIISRNTLEVQEIILCRALLNWAKIQCTKQDLDPTPENQRNVLGDLIYFIRFRIINKTQLFSSPVYDLLTEGEKSVVMSESCELPHPWPSIDIDRGIKQRKLILKVKEGESRKLLKSLFYFVFAKNGFIHDMKIGLSAVKKCRFSTLTDRGVEKLVKKIETDNGVYVFDSVYVKAFQCYKLEFEFFKIYKVYDGPSSLGYEVGNDHAVFFSVSDTQIVDYVKFLSTDNWKKQFSSQEFDLSDATTCISDVTVTFC